MLARNDIISRMNIFNQTRRNFVKQVSAAAVLAGMPVFTQGCTENPAKSIAVKILIIGGGAAGISVASRLRRILNKADITIVDPAEKHFYQPGFTFIGAGIWKADDVWMKQEKLIPSGVRWIKDSIIEVDAAHNSATLKGGNKISYDFLVLCPGLQENWSLIQGITKETLGQGNAHSIYDWQGSCKTWTAVDKFARTGGRGIFTDTWTKHKCGGAPKKICLLTEQLARKHGKREACTFKYFTGSKELYNVPHYTPRLLEIYKEREIPVSVRCRLTGVDTATKRAYFLNSETGQTFTENYDILHFAPPQSAPDFVRNSGLGWQEGKLAPEAWVKTDKKTFVHLDNPNIICLGDAAGIPTSKTSAAIRKQAPIAVENLCSLIAGKAPESIYDGYAACPIITDYGHVLMAEFDYEKKCKQSFPFSLIDTTKELRSAWWLKLYVLKPMYFHLMLRGLA